MRDLIALLVALTICVALLAVVADMVVRSTLDPTDRGLTLGALGSIGLALALALGRYLNDGDDEH